jgi:hypothetical protein
MWVEIRDRLLRRDKKYSIVVNKIYRGQQPFLR